MAKKIWCHPFAPAAIKRKVWKRYQNPGLSAYRLNAMSTPSPGNTAEAESRTDPWIGLFADPALHEALDRIIANNHIA